MSHFLSIVMAGLWLVPGITEESAVAIVAVLNSLSSFRDAPLGADPESILPMVVMDSGLARSLSSGRALRGPGGAPRNDSSISWGGLISPAPAARLRSASGFRRKSSLR